MSVAEAAALGVVNWDRACYQAAMAAQDMYDREIGKDDEKKQVNENSKMD